MSEFLSLSLAPFANCEPFFRNPVSTNDSVGLNMSCLAESKQPIFPWVVLGGYEGVLLIDEGEDRVRGRVMRNGRGIRGGTEGSEDWRRERRGRRESGEIKKKMVGRGNIGKGGVDIGPGGVEAYPMSTPSYITKQIKS